VHLLALLEHLVKFLQISAFEYLLDFLVYLLVEFLRLFLVPLHFIPGLLEVAVFKSFISCEGLEPVVVGLHLSLVQFVVVKSFSGSFDGKSAVSKVDTLLSEGSFEFLFEVFSHFWLRGGLLINPETHLVGEFLVVETGG